MADVIQFPGAARFQHEQMTWEAIVWLKAARCDAEKRGERIALSVDTADVLLLYIEHLAGRLGIIPPPSGPEAA